ncbi:hypothetical protein [Methylomonas paludis]|uniref:hypothetical protein n=1 Tax=Methylomonas paludis TaxID=1173101 RepID=UPI001FEB6623|nr:hypothetical protein [Methylomonas paludis]
MISDEGYIATNALAKVLHITQNDLAEVTGLSRDSVTKRSRCKSRSTQARLRDTVEIINRVAEWSGGVGQAFAWFRSPYLHLVIKQLRLWSKAVRMQLKPI